MTPHCLLPRRLTSLASAGANSVRGDARAQRRRRRPLADGSNPASGEVLAPRTAASPKEALPSRGSGCDARQPTASRVHTTAQHRLSRKPGGKTRPLPGARQRVDDGSSAGPTCTERGDLPAAGAGGRVPAAPTVPQPALSHPAAHLPRRRPPARMRGSLGGFLRDTCGTRV